MIIEENGKKYKIVKCDTPKLLEEFTEFNKKYDGNVVAIDLEFNAKIAMSTKFPNETITESRRVALIQLNYESKNPVIYVIDPNELSTEQTEVFVNNIICNEKITKILHGADALDIPYIYNKLLSGNRNNVLKFTKNFIDTRYLCEYDENKLCQIYELLHTLKIFDDKKKQYLEENEVKIGNLYDVYIDIHDLSDELLIYSVYDVVYLDELYKFYCKKNKEIYCKYIPEVMRIVYLHKKQFYDIIQFMELTVTKMNNYIIYVSNDEKIILHNLYLICISMFENEMINKLMNINFFRSEMMILFKFILFDTLNLNFEIYKNKMEKYNEACVYDKLIEKIEKIHYMYFMDIVVTIRKFCIELIN